MGMHLRILRLMLGNRIHLVRRPGLLLSRPFHIVGVIVRRECRPFQILHNKKILLLLLLHLRLVKWWGGRELMRRVRCRAYCRWYLVVGCGMGLEREVCVVERTGKRRMMRRGITVGGMVKRRGSRRQLQRGAGEIEAEMGPNLQWVACLNLRIELNHRRRDRSRVGRRRRERTGWKLM